MPPIPRVTIDLLYLAVRAPAGLPDPAYDAMARVFARPAFRRAAAQACRRFPALARVTVRPGD